MRRHPNFHRYRAHLIQRIRRLPNTKKNLSVIADLTTRARQDPVIIAEIDRWLFRRIAIEYPPKRKPEPAESHNNCRTTVVRIGTAEVVKFPKLDHNVTNHIVMVGPMDEKNLPPGVTRKVPSDPSERCSICYTLHLDLGDHIRVAHRPNIRVAGEGLFRGVEPYPNNGSAQDKSPDFGWDEKDPDGVQKTFQSLRGDKYGIDWEKRPQNAFVAINDGLNKDETEDMEDGSGRSKSTGDRRERGGACNGCRRKKLKCSGEADGCTRCQEHNTKCSYTGSGLRSFSASPISESKGSPTSETAASGIEDQEDGEVTNYTDVRSLRSNSSARGSGDGEAASGTRRPVQYLLERGRELKEIASAQSSTAGKQIPYKLTITTTESLGPPKRKRFNTVSTPDVTPTASSATQTFSSADCTPTTSASTQLSPAGLIPRDSQGRLLTKTGAPRAERGSLARKMPTYDGSKEDKGNPDAWFPAYYVVPDDYKNSKPVELFSHEGKPWVTFHNELRNLSRTCAARFIPGRVNGFGLEDGNWYYTFMGKGLMTKNGERVWGALGENHVSYRDVVSAVNGNKNNHGILVMHELQWKRAMQTGRIGIVNNWAEHPDVFVEDFL